MSTSKRLVAALLLGALITGVLVAARRPNLSVSSNIRFATASDGPLMLDVYQPTAPGPHPVMVLIHGGSWKGGDKTDWARLAPRIVDAGYVAFSINYRLVEPGDDLSWRAPLRDIESGLDWVIEHAARFGGDPTRVAVLGSSAGAHLSLLMEIPPGAIDVLGVLSPPADLEALSAGPLGGAVTAYLGCSPRRCPQRYSAASPVTQARTTLPPTFLSYSTDELIPRAQEDALAGALSEAGVEVETRVFPGSKHALLIGPQVLEDALGFFAAHLR